LVFFRPLPYDYATARRSDLNGQLSRAVTTVVPQNPFNQMENQTPTTNASLDSRPHVLIQSLPRNTTSPPKETRTDEKPDKNNSQN